jgi:hypothetical protein
MSGFAVSLLGRSLRTTEKASPSKGLRPTHARGRSNQHRRPHNTGDLNVSPGVNKTALRDCQAHVGSAIHRLPVGTGDEEVYR